MHAGAIVSARSRAQPWFRSDAPPIFGPMLDQIAERHAEQLRDELDAFIQLHTLSGALGMTVEQLLMQNAASYAKWAAAHSLTLSLAGIPFARVVDGEPTAMDGSPLPDGDIRHPAKT